MKSRHFFLMVGGLAIGLLSPMAMAKEDITNSYFNTNTPLTPRTVIMQGSQNLERSMLIEGSTSSPVVIERTLSSPVVVERTLSSPVMVQRQPMVIEDRIIKQKHLFGIGIWPLFDFEVL